MSFKTVHSITKYFTGNEFIIWKIMKNIYKKNEKLKKS